MLPFHCLYISSFLEVRNRIKIERAKALSVKKEDMNWLLLITVNIYFVIFVSDQYGLGINSNTNVGGKERDH